MTPYNQIAITNKYINNVWKAVEDKNVPWWGKKLMAPAFYKDDKWYKLLKQMEWKRELEQIKFRQGLEFNPDDREQGKIHAAEITEFLEDIKSRQLEEELKDVFVTDHKPKDKKFTTLSSDEDELFYKYSKSLKDYNRKDPRPNDLRVT